MFKHLGSRNAALFCDVTHQNYRCALCFCSVYKHRSALAYLRYAAGDCRAFRVIHCLNGVNYYNIGRQLFCAAKNIFNVCFRQQIDAFALYAEPLCTQRNLRRGLLAGNVKHRFLLGHFGTDLKEQSRLSYSRLAGKQYDRAADKPPAEDSVKLADACRRAHIFWNVSIAEKHRLSGFTRTDKHILSPGALFLFRDGRLIGFLRHCVPRSAGRTATEPFCALIVALGAYVNGFLTFQLTSSVMVFDI